VTLIVQQLSHAYGEIEALRQVSAAASAGKITAILGPNAAGKSTLLKCMIGAIRPTSGMVSIDGKPAHKTHPYWLARKVAYVPQRSTVSAAFTVRQVVELGRYVLPVQPRRIDEALKRLELIELADRPYAALSVGQQQRVTLARAYAQLEPGGHLILDEPMSAMDLRHVRDGMALLRELADQGATVLIAMHDLSLAASAADEAWLLHEGRLVAGGETCSVLNVELLRRVFDVEFRWIAAAANGGGDQSGGPWLVSVRHATA
jgi:ABC-type cobalamin/Fe3+-siderophores transport system ATPase subunit